jgi:aminoglycoside phosphotransferase (APT) family kinase protein
MWSATSMASGTSLFPATFSRGALPVKPALPVTPAVELASAAAVGAVLLDYLGQRLGCQVSFAEPPAAVDDGWETFIYKFQLEGPGLPPRWDQPLLLRLHANGEALLRAQHEFAVHRFLAELTYPVPAALLLEESCSPFGGPFLIMEQVAGPTLLRAMLRRPWWPFHFVGCMAATHARLHALPSDGFPRAPGLFLARSLATLRRAMEVHGMDGLIPGQDWLEVHAPPAPAMPSVLHLDYHPLNLIERDDGTLVVLDWTYADLGDPHADVATTLLLLECAPVHGASLLERMATCVGRPVTAAWYLHCYRHQRPLDDDRLTYFKAWSALGLLVRYGRWLRAGPESSGCKASLIEHLDGDFLGTLCRYFHRCTGIDVLL